jgi:hypothetical protein
LSLTLAFAACAAAVVRRLTGPRTLYQTAERRAQRAVAVSFWLLAPLLGRAKHKLGALTIGG